MADAVPVVFAVADSTVSPTNAGLIATSDIHARTCEPVRNPFFFDGTGFSGLAYDSASQLWATTSHGIGSSSSLVRLQVSSGRILETLNVSRAGHPLSIGDLAFDSGTDTLLGIRSALDSGGGGGELYAIDRTTGEATFVGNTGLGNAGAIGFGSQGELYVTSFDTSANTASLHTLDRGTAAVTRTIVLSNPSGQFGAPAGLSDETVDGLLIASDSRSSEVVAIDPITGIRTVIDLAGAPFGVAGDVALIPFAHSRDIVYQQDFEHGTGGFTVDNSGGTIPGLWHLSVGRRDDGLINHTRVNSFYYGAFETNVGRGTYLRPFDHEGVIISPEIVLPAAGVSTLSFNYLLETRPQLDRDFVDVSIDNGTTITQILSRQDGTLPQTGRTKWLTATQELAAFAGQTIRIRFHFDTGDTPAVDPEGWYVDDLRITTIADSADLGVSKSIDDETPNEGQLVTYTVTASNSIGSLSTATNVVVTDNLPSGVTFVSATPSEGSFDPMTGRWTGLELDPGETQTLLIQATVNIGTAGAILTNAAVIDADEEDPDNTDDEVVIMTPVNSVDLAVTKTTNDETPNVGQSVIYTLSATNAATSNATATGVKVQEALPDGVTFVSASSPDFDPVTQVWMVGDLVIGETATLMFTVSVNPGTAGASLSNTVSISGAETDPDLSDNTDTQTSVVNSVDLAVTKTTDDVTPNVGQSVVYTLTATNAATSNAAATGVKVQETLPDGVTFVSASSPDFDPVTQVWMVSDLVIGETSTLMITVSVNPGTAGASLANTVSISGDETDPDLSDNTETQTSVVNSVDLAVAKSADNPSPTEGNRVAFTITVNNSNSSNNSATGVKVTDELPAGVTFISSSATEGSYDPVTHLWTGLELLPNETQTLEIVVSVDSGTAGTTITNSVMVEGNETDPDLSNNMGLTTINVQPQAMQTVQFISPLGVFRDGPFVIPAEERLAILGRLWHDQNSDGVWDADEPALDGATVELVRGTTVLVTTQTRAVDLNGDGVFDPVSERGLYWFQQSGAVPAGNYTVRLHLPTGETASSLTTPVEYPVEILVAQPSLVSEPLQNSAPNFGVNRDIIANPAAGRAAIIGYSWSDLDLDGQWDAHEVGRSGFAFYLDLNNDNEFDPETEPTALTGEDGKYVFADIPAGNHVIREILSGTSPISRQTFPTPAAAATPVDAPLVTSGIAVTVADGAVVSGTFGQSAVANVGSFDYATIVRPADELQARVVDPLVGEALVSSLMPWQSFTITNTTPTSFRIAEISKLSISGEGASFVSVMQFNSSRELVPVIDQFELASGESVTYLVFYDPAVRDSIGVVSQSPEWLGGTSPVHTFEDSDKLEVITDTGLSFPVKLIGGSTFDSDVSYDGTVNLVDFNLLDQLLRLEPVIEQPSPTNIDSPRFDPTMDINARCPNGANLVTETCSFPINGVPRRELSLGDFGPLNVEFGKSRATIADQLFALLGQ